MKVVRGIILLEVLISIMISSMIFMSLMNAVFQLSKARVTVDDSIDVYTRVTTIFDLMQQDFGGATVPVQTEFSDETQKKGVDVQQKEEPKKEETSKPQGEEQLGQEKKTKPIKNIFYSTLKNNNVDTVSCITNNPTVIYWSERAGKAKPRIVRVVYTLVPDPVYKESFLLKRQEGTDLDLDAYKNLDQSAVRAYEIAQGIKGYKVTYLYLEKKEEKAEQSSVPPQKNGASKDTPTKKEAPEKPDYKLKDDWGTIEKKESEGKTTKEPLLPSHMVVSLTMFNSTYKKDYSFEFVITLPANEAQQVKQAKMRYQEAPTKTTVPQKALLRTEKTDQNSLQTNAKSKPDASSEPLLIVFNNKEKPQPLPHQVLDDSEQQQIENSVQKNIEQFYQQIEQEGKSREEQFDMQEKTPSEDDIIYSEQIDIPEGKIDIVHDGDATHIVYQGPLTLTPETVRGLS